MQLDFRWIELLICTWLSDARNAGGPRACVHHRVNLSAHSREGCTHIDKEIQALGSSDAYMNYQVIHNVFDVAQIQSASLPHCQFAKQGFHAAARTARVRGVTAADPLQVETPKDKTTKLTQANLA